MEYYLAIKMNELLKQNNMDITHKEARYEKARTA